MLIKLNKTITIAPHFFRNLQQIIIKYKTMGIGNIFRAFQLKDKIFFVLFEQVAEN